MEGLTVKALHTLTYKLIKEGMGDKKVFLSSDEEGNSYRPLAGDLIVNPENVRDAMAYSLFDAQTDPDNTILLF